MFSAISGLFLSRLGGINGPVGKQVVAPQVRRFSLSKDARSALPE
jgi:hypothetical protein